MSTIHKAAITRAVALLSAAGARFGIEYEGISYGEALPAQKSGRTRRASIEVDGTIPYRAIMDHLKPGDVHTWNCGTPQMAKALRGCLSARGNYTRGKGGVITETRPDRCSVTLLVVNPLLPDVKPVEYAPPPA